MKLSFYVFIYLFIIFYAYNVFAQEIITFAGNGIPSNTGDGNLASSASIDYPCGEAFDKFGNDYITTGTYGNTIRKISTSGIIYTIAGTGSAGFSGDAGPATSAKLNNPQYIAIDSTGNIFFSDCANNRIRKIDINTGLILTIAGNGTAGYAGNGISASSAILSDPNGIAIDKKGNIYFADYGNSRIRKIDVLGIISDFAGTGIAGYNGDGGLADTSQIRGVFSVACDKIGNLYIGDEANGRIRKVDTFGFIHTIAGNGIPGNIGDEGLATVAEVRPHCIICDKYGNIYMSDIYTNTVRRINAENIINTVAGNGIQGFIGDNGPATNAEFYSPSDITVDSCGNLYISDLNNYRIRKVAFNPFCIPTEINIIKNEEDLSIYPNPTYNELIINNVKLLSSYHLVNIVGTTMQQGTIKKGNNSISLQSLPDGIYLLVIIDEQKNKTLSKIVKQ